MPTWTDRMRDIVRDHSKAAVAAAEAAMLMTGFPVTSKRVAFRCAVAGHLDFQGAAWREALHVVARSLSPLCPSSRPAGLPLIGQ